MLGGIKVIYDLNKLPDSRGAKKKYHWHKLDKIGSYFVWDKIEDRKKITSASQNLDFKITCRKINSKLHVIRIS